MPKFIYAYKGGRRADGPVSQDAEMAKWKSWMGGLGKALVEAGGPVGKSYTLSSQGTADNGGADPLFGYSIVEAADVQAALALGKGCPILEHGGRIEVCELIAM